LLLNLQALRAVAAYMVVMHHVFFPWNDYLGAPSGIRVDYDLGAHGVDIFFVISGFIMAETTRQARISPAQFISRRLRRVVPLYWLVTGAVCLGVLAGLQISGLRSLDAAQVLKSLFFIPILPGCGTATGPIVFVGWTLNYEMYFHLLFSISLLASRTGSRLAVVTLLLLMPFVAKAALGSPYVDYYASSLVFEFMFGMLIAFYAPREAWRWGAAYGWVCLGTGTAAMLALSEPILWGIAEIMRGLGTGVPAALIVLGAVLLERNQRIIRDGFIIEQGNASYSIYLTHASSGRPVPSSASS
jgi:exopolysaccharide production protein ExoZ